MNIDPIFSHLMADDAPTSEQAWNTAGHGTRRGRRKADLAGLSSDFAGFSVPADSSAHVTAYLTKKLRVLDYTNGSAAIFLPCAERSFMPHVGSGNLW
jgi:hypothetical protein